MTFLVVARPKFQIPPEMVPMLSDAAKQWFSRYESKLESFGNFAAGGGYGVVEAEDEETLFRSLWEMPFIPFSEVTVDPIWPGAGAFDLFRDTVQQMLSAMQQGGAH